MSITREQAAAWFETMHPPGPAAREMYRMAAKALRPVSRDQVEKVWTGCEYCEKHKINLVRIEMNYNDSPGSPERLNPTRVPKFCPMCGRPLTDEAVEMVMERLEALNEDNGCS